MHETLQTALKKLRLSGLAQSLEVRLQEASGNGLNHLEFLELILQDELAVRSQRLIGRRVKSAAFRELKTLEDFDWSFNPVIKKKQIFDLATGRFIRENKSVLFLGPPERARVTCARRSATRPSRPGSWFCTVRSSTWSVTSCTTKLSPARTRCR